MCFEDDEGLVKNEQLLESYLEPARFPAPLTVEGVSVCMWSWGNTIDAKIIFPLSHMTLDQMQLECSLRWQPLVAKTCSRQVPRGKNHETSSFSTGSSGLSEVAANGMESCWTLGYLG